MFVKVCGLRLPADVAAAVDSGADAVGFVLTTSPRRVDVRLVPLLASQVPPQVLTVAVFRGEPLAQIAKMALAARVNAVQLHGRYCADDYRSLERQSLRLLRAVTSNEAAALRCGEYGEHMLVVDSPAPGSGQAWDWLGLSKRPMGQWILAGGLHADNVGEAVSCLSPWGVDVSSGVERSRGVKDSRLIRDFVIAAKRAGCRQSTCGQS